MRQVYFDPFGSYQSGYDAGTAREGQTQAATRTARQEDFNYNYKEPLKLAEMQRDDTVGKFSLPYRLKDVEYGDQLTRDKVFNSGIGIKGDYANHTGDASKALDAYLGYVGVHTGPAPVVQQPAPFNPNNTGAILTEHGYTSNDLVNMHPQQAQTLAEVLHHSKQLTAQEQAGVNAQEAAQFGVPAQTSQYNMPHRGMSPQDAETKLSNIETTAGHAIDPTLRARYKQYMITGADSQGRINGQAALPSVLPGPTQPVQNNQFNTPQVAPQVSAPVAVPHPNGGIGYYDNNTGKLLSVVQDPNAAFFAEHNFARNRQAALDQWGYGKDAYEMNAKTAELHAKDRYNDLLHEQNLRSQGTQQFWEPQ